MQHVQIPRNRCLPFARCLNALLCCLLFIWQRKWLPSFGRSWHILPRGSMMTALRISYALTTGCSPSIKNCCIHRHVTMPQGLVKRIDPAMAWPVSPHTLGRPRNWNQLLLAPDSQTGLAVFAMLILCRCGFLPTGPLWYCTSCNTRRMSTGGWLDTAACREVSSRASYIEARCHYRGVQDQRCLSLGYH